MHTTNISNDKSDQPLEMCSLDEAHRLFDEFFKSFNISDIPLSVRKKAVEKDYEEIYDDYKTASYGYLGMGEWTDDNSFFEEIYEAFSDDASSTQYVAELLREKYEMDNCQLKAVHPYKAQIVSADEIPNYLATTCSVLFPLVKNNADIIKKEMGKNGYSLACEERFHDEATNCNWAWLMFDPKRKENIIDEENIL